MLWPLSVMMLHTAASSPILSAHEIDSVFTLTVSGRTAAAAPPALVAALTAAPLPPPPPPASSRLHRSSSSSQLLSEPLPPGPPHLRCRRACSLRNCLIFSFAVRVRTKPTHCSWRRTIEGVTVGDSSRRTSTTSPLEST
jgi:hypothetical protein